MGMSLVCIIPIVVCHSCFKGCLCSKCLGPVGGGGGRGGRDIGTFIFLDP